MSVLDCTQETDAVVKLTPGKQTFTKEELCKEAGVKPKSTRLALVLPINNEDIPVVAQKPHSVAVLRTNPEEKEDRPPKPYTQGIILWIREEKRSISKVQLNINQTREMLSRRWNEEKVGKPIDYQNRTWTVDWTHNDTRAVLEDPKKNRRLVEITLTKKWIVEHTEPTADPKQPNTVTQVVINTRWAVFLEAHFLLRRELQKTFVDVANSEPGKKPSTYRVDLSDYRNEDKDELFSCIIEGKAAEYPYRVRRRDYDIFKDNEEE